MQIQQTPNLIWSERRLCLTRIYWDHGVVGDGNGYSASLSLSLCFEPRDMWIGLYWTKGWKEWFAWLCLIPCLPLRIHFHKSYGGRFTK